MMERKRIVENARKILWNEDNIDNYIVRIEELLIENSERVVEINLDEETSHRLRSRLEEKNYHIREIIDITESPDSEVYILHISLKNQGVPLHA